MSKAIERRNRILEFFEWLKKQDEWAARDNLLQAYSFKTGISVRTLREYYDVLSSINAVGIENVKLESKKPDGSLNKDRDGNVRTYYRRKRVFAPENLN